MSTAKYRPKEVEIKMSMFKVVSVFDSPKPRVSHYSSLQLTWQVMSVSTKIFMEALKRSSPVPIAFEHMEAQEKMVISVAVNSNTLREGMSEVQRPCRRRYMRLPILSCIIMKKKNKLVKEDEAAPPPIPKDRRTEESRSRKYCLRCMYLLRYQNRRQ